MGVKRSELAVGVVWAVLLAAVASSAAGTCTICDELSIEPCTGLPYTQTGFPNSFGHESLDQVPPILGHTIQLLIIIGCYDNAQLFLCAAAFPRCTTGGQLLPPCRSLCESAMAGCRFWFNYYAETFDGMNCTHMPNSNDPSICVGLNTSPSPVATVTSKRPTDQVRLATIFRTKSANSTSTVGTKITEISTSETRFVTPLPRQPAIPSSSDDDDLKNEGGDKGKITTLLNVARLNFTSGVKGQWSTETKGGLVLTDSVEKSVKTDKKLQDKSQSQNAVPGFGVALGVLSCAAMVLLLISCAFLRKAFGKPYGGRRRKPRDGAFYTNPAFSDLPQSTIQGVGNGNGELGRLPQQPYTLADLPPHPASSAAPPIPPRPGEGNIYQQEPDGFIEQNLFVAPQYPSSDCPNDAHQQKGHDATPGTKLATVAERPHITSDLVYSNKATAPAMDTNANEHGAAFNESENNRNAIAPSRGEPFSVENVDGPLEKVEFAGLGNR